MKGEVKMPKIKAVKFIEHPVLGNLELNFCDAYDNPVDTVIFAGENGVGKSTILQELYNITSGQMKNEVSLENPKQHRCARHTCSPKYVEST